MDEDKVAADAGAADAGASSPTGDSNTPSTSYQIPEPEALLKSHYWDLEPDEDLDLNEAHNQVWLVKVPKFLWDGWSKVKQDGVHLGTVRVYK
jgi:TFIIF, beta subunit N-terminus